MMILIVLTNTFRDRTQSADFLLICVLYQVPRKQSLRQGFLSKWLIGKESCPDKGDEESRTVQGKEPSSDVVLV